MKRKPRKDKETKEELLIRIKNIECLFLEAERKVNYY
jgi:hypothetical protein